MSGFRINHNLNTYQQRDLEIIFIADCAQGRYSFTNKWKECRCNKWKKSNKFVINNNNPKVSNDFQIHSLMIYRPFVKNQITNDSNQDNDDDSSSQQDNDQQLLTIIITIIIVIWKQTNE